MPVRLIFTLLLLGTAFTAGCVEGGEMTAESSDAAAFVTLLGDDTLAVESFTRTSNGVTADVVLRAPETTRRNYVLELDDSGLLDRYEVEVRSDTSADRREVVTPAGDSLRVEISDGDDSSVHMIAGGPDALPFIDMVHWPFDLMLARARVSSADSTVQPLFTGRGTMDFVVRDLAEDSMTITHPFRGTMAVDVDAEGRLQRLDAGATTRKLIVTRVPEVDVDAVAERFAERDAAGRSFGPLSGRGEASAEIDGAAIVVDYGQPSRRGRAIFGALVPYGELWRTGANRATHLETDRAIRFGESEGLLVPAGEYTLYTIPEQDGGVLIINGQTGQGGTTYNEDQDVGRVDMQKSDLPDTVEDFTFVVEDDESGGVLKLRWDRTEYAVPFTVE